MAVCIECAKRVIWNSETPSQLQHYIPVECEPCQAKGIGCEECGDKTRVAWPALCHEHAERESVKFKAAAMQKDMERIAARLAKLEEVAQAAWALMAPKDAPDPVGLRKTLEALD